MDKASMTADYIPLHITSVCTLRCRHCGNGFPKYKPQRHSEKQIIISTLEKVFSIFNNVTELRIAGAEALLHPDIGEIMAEAAKYSKQFERMVVVTNGTYVPRASVLSAIAGLQCNAIVYVNDYGKLSVKLEEVLEGLRNYGIKADLRHYNDEKQYYGGWIDLGIDEFSKKNYPPKKLTEVFRVCRKNYYVFDGRTYGCCPASALYETGFLPPPSSDYVDMLSEKTVEEKRAVIAKLFDRPYLACGYCNGYDVENGKRIKAAEQIGE